MKNTLIIVDDHVLFSNGIKMMLEDDFEILAQINQAKDVIPMVLQCMPDVLLLDINLNNNDGLLIAQELKSQFDIKIIMLTMHDENRFVERAKKFGIEGYMLKSSTKDELTECIRAVLKGRPFYEKSVLPTKRKKDFFDKKALLTPREKEIIQLIKLGLSSSQIASKTCVTEETVKSHRKNIYFKLNINKMSELLEYFD